MFSAQYNISFNLLWGISLIDLQIFTKYHAIYLPITHMGFMDSNSCYITNTTFKECEHLGRNRTYISRINNPRINCYCFQDF